MSRAPRYTQVMDSLTNVADSFYYSMLSIWHCNHVPLNFIQFVFYWPLHYNLHCCRLFSPASGRDTFRALFFIPSTRKSQIWNQNDAPGFMSFIFHERNHSKRKSMEQWRAEFKKFQCHFVLRHGRIFPVIFLKVQYSEDLLFSCQLFFCREMGGREAVSYSDTKRWTVSRESGNAWAIFFQGNFSKELYIYFSLWNMYTLKKRKAV